MTIDDKFEVQDAADSAPDEVQQIPATPELADTVSPPTTPTSPDGASKDATVVHEVRNCTNDHVVVTAGSRCFHMSPLAMADVDEPTIETFALRSLAEQHVVRVSESLEGSTGGEGGIAAGIGFWVIIIYFSVLSNIDSHRGKLIFGIAAPIVVILVGGLVFAKFKKRLAAVGQGLSLVVVFMLGAGLPIGVAMVFGDLPDLVRDGNSAELFGRLSQTLLIVLAALVPTVLYYIFDRQRAMTIRRNFQQQILRLDPALDTLYDIDAKYGDLLIEAVGRDGVQRARANSSNPYPIFMAAALIVLGWLLVLPVVDDGPSLADATTVSSYFAPRQTTYVFGFLGAYFFSINLIARRYVRGDLRPKAYGSITVRILTVFILSWVLEVAFDAADWIYVAAFLVGILPETFFTLVAEGRRAILGKISDAMREPHPLTSLEGIDLYDRARLQDEGVNNVEALAHHDLVELMLGTRIPVPRLVDWVDQAILYLHTVDERGKPYGREHLRACGIRTASDLITVHDKAELWQALLSSDPVQPGVRLNVVAEAIADDEWMTDILAWRHSENPGERRFEVVGGQLAVV